MHTFPFCFCGSELLLRLEFMPTSRGPLCLVLVSGANCHADALAAQNRVRDHSLPGSPISIARYNCGGTRGILRAAELRFPWEFQLFTVQQYATWGGFSTPLTWFMLHVCAYPPVKKRWYPAMMMFEDTAPIAVTDRAVSVTNR